jgi:formamidopyrimidine-DNA glycosylase
MPELPDLQVFSHNLNKALNGKEITSISMPVSKKLNVPVSKLKKTIEGRSIEKIYREGKELYFAFDKGNILAMHLMLHGNLYLFSSKNENKHTVFEMHFDDKTGLALTDWQNAAVVTLNPEPNNVPDALSEEADFKYLKSKMKTKSNIKTLLLNQKIIRGIGNAYADEILWDAKISPFSASNKIPDKEIHDLMRSIKNVLANAEKQIVKTNPDIITGEVRNFLLIHNSKKKESPSGAPIEHATNSSRKTYYTKEQTLFE